MNENSEREPNAILDREPVILKKKPAVKAYSKAEDQLIMDTVMQYPDNMAHAFSQVAIKLKGRKVTSIASRYHYMIRQGKQKSNIVTGSPAGFTARKTNQRKNGHFHRKEPLQPLIVIFKQLLDFNHAERKKIIDFLKSIE